MKSKVEELKEVIEEVCYEICNEYCKYPAKCLEEVKDPDDAHEYMLQRYCENCPLNKIN